MASVLTIKTLLAEGGESKVGELPFEAAMKLLEELVHSVESGTLSLEDSMLSYERGVSLVSHLRKILSGAEEKLRILQKEEK